MNLQEMLGYTVNSLRHRRLRSFLTVLGIVVGISSIVLLVGLVQGLKQDVLKQLEGFGPRTLIIIPTNIEKAGAAGGSPFAPTSGKLLEKDFERIKRMPEIKTISRVISGSTTMGFKDQTINVQIYGVEPDTFKDTSTLTVDTGRFLAPNDRGVAVLGSKVAEGFKKNITSGSIVSLGGRTFRVVGTLKSTGTSFGGIDNIAFIQFDEARDIFNRSLLENEISAIRLTLKEGTDIVAATEEATRIMLDSHRLTEDQKDFGVISPTFINKQFSGILDTLSLFLGAIASISLIVGGIGISNTMFMSVLERRKEIGTMKAVGGTQAQIRNLFLLESSLIGFAGGLAGVLLACLIGFVIHLLAAVTFVFDPLVIGGALFFSVIIGVISGTFPATDAAKVDPIVALRYE
ncbi:MAG: ABC transporter permease [Candidatus Micrarchaeia archaeon]